MGGQAHHGSAMVTPLINQRGGPVAQQQFHLPSFAENEIEEEASYQEFALNQRHQQLVSQSTTISQDPYGSRTIKDRISNSKHAAGRSDRKSSQRRKITVNPSAQSPLLRHTI